MSRTIPLGGSAALFASYRRTERGTRGRSSCAGASERPSWGAMGCARPAPMAFSWNTRMSSDCAGVSWGIVDSVPNWARAGTAALRATSRPRPRTVLICISISFREHIVMPITEQDQAWAGQVQPQLPVDVLRLFPDLREAPAVVPPQGCDIRHRDIGNSGLSRRDRGTPGRQPWQPPIRL